MPPPDQRLVEIRHIANILCPVRASCSAWAICLGSAGRLHEARQSLCGERRWRCQFPPIHFRRHSSCQPPCQRCYFAEVARPPTGLRPAGGRSYSFHPGTGRLPVRRFPSKICAALALPRRLRLAGTDRSLSRSILLRGAVRAGWRGGNSECCRAFLRDNMRTEYERCIKLLNGITGDPRWSRNYDSTTQRKVRGANIMRQRRR